MQRVTDPADPRRCQGHVSEGQCPNLSVEGGEYCMAHGGFHAMIRQETADRRLYQLTEARSQGRVAELAQHDPTSFLYSVTGVAVLLLEKMQRAAAFDDVQFVSSYSDVASLQTVIERLKRSTIKIQQTISTLVPKASLYEFQTVLLDLAQFELTNSPSADKIMNRLRLQTTTTIKAAANEEGLPSLETSQPLARTLVFKLDSPGDSQRLAELVRHDGLMSLYEEIAILIANIERRWNLVHDDMGLFSACSQLTQGLKNLEKLIKSAHEQAQAIGELLSPVARRQAVLEMISTVSIEFKRLPNFELCIDRLRDRVMLHFSQSTSPPPDEESGSSSVPLLE